jgi:aquaporin related protein
VPFLGTLPECLRINAVTLLAEFVGTFLFLFFAFVGSQLATNAARPSTEEAMKNGGLALGKISDSTRVTLVALAFGISLMANAWAFGRISGGLFNPAVSWPLIIGSSHMQVLDAISSVVMV